MSEGAEEGVVAVLKAASLEEDVCDSIREGCGAECVNCDPSDPGALCHARYLNVMGLLEEAEAALHFWPGAE